jgi:hypothetical protein
MVSPLCAGAHPGSGHASSRDCVVDDQHDDRPNDSDKHAVKIEAGNARRAKGGEDEASDNCSDHAKDDVEKEALTGSVDDFAADEPGDEAQDDPTKYGHFTCLLTQGEIPCQHTRAPQGSSPGGTSFPRAGDRDGIVQSRGTARC